MQLTIQGILEVVGLELESVDILNNVRIRLLLLLLKRRIEGMRGLGESEQDQQSCQRYLNPHQI